MSQRGVKITHAQITHSPHFPFHCCCCYGDGGMQHSSMLMLIYSVMGFGWGTHMLEVVLAHMLRVEQALSSGACVYSGCSSHQGCSVFLGPHDFIVVLAPM